VRLRLDIANLDRWQELLEVMSRHKTRTILTGLMVSWGIFILIILLGAGNGMHRGATDQFKDDALNSIFMWRGRTSLPHKGHSVGREIQFDNADFDAIRDQIPGVEHATGRYMLWDATIRRGDKSANYRVRATHPEHVYLERTIIVEGRYINETDVRERRKVAVLGTAAVEHLFGDEPAIGKHIEVGKIAYTVVGISTDEGDEGELERIFIPVSTAQAAYGAGDQLHMILFTMGDASVSESKAIEQKVRTMMAQNHHFDQNDPRAIRINNNIENFENINQLLIAIQLFVWMIGIGTIIAGVVGVSNIMLIAVKERTREFGIRKALGAPPFSIVSSVVLEAIVLTAVAGYLGLVGGMAVLDLGLLPEHDYLKNPSVDVGTVLAAMGVIVFFGTLAGYFPARRAAKVNPVVALRDE
jgi:putative ABC transport system permease protein